MVEALAKAADQPLDCHLMIEDPDRWAPAYAEAGASQRDLPRRGGAAPVRLARELRAKQARAGMALKPGDRRSSRTTTCCPSSTCCW